MKKYKVLMIAAIAAIGFAFTSCNKFDNELVDREVAISGDGIDNGLLRLTVGETVQLSGKILPQNTKEGAIAWTSDNETVATVENGLVTAVAAGEAVISAVEQNNSVCGAGQILVIVQEAAPVSPETLDIKDETKDQNEAE